MTTEKLHFESLLIKTDVTALKILNNDSIIIGIGNILSLYNLSSKIPCSSSAIFMGQKIHGLVQSRDNTVAIYGGKQIKTCVIDTNQSSLTVNNTHIQCDDWILTLIWTKNDTEFALLTAHNIVQIWCISSNSIKTQFKCEEKCILYSGLLRELFNSVVVFAGTVFSQVVIWSTFSEQVLNRLIGHKGVIFSISYSESEKIIVTTSDDRSVKLWSIDDQNIDENEKYWSNVKISLKCSLFGHTARVMRNAIVKDYIISVGEDAIMCIWKTSGDLIRKQKLYQDGCLWSLDCNLQQNIIVTGSSNSGVMLHRLISDLNNTNDQIQELTFPNPSFTAKHVAISAADNIITLTENGELMYYDKETKAWKLYYVDNIKACTMVVSICRKYIAVTDLNGHLVIFQENVGCESMLSQIFTQKICDGRILSTIWLFDDKICVCDKNGMITVRNLQGEKINEFNLPSCKERWITVAAIILNDSLIVGDRCGNIHLYVKNSIDPIQTLFKVHGRLGTNFIKVKSDKVITVGRDSSVKFFIITNNDKLHLHFLHCIKLPFNWIDRFLGMNDYLVCGFRETDFIIWDLIENQQLLEIKCGGGHRSWDIAKKSANHLNGLNDYIFEFVFIKNSVINVLEVKNDDVSKCFVDAFHVKEINALKVLKHDEEKFTIISAGEDTSLVFNRCKIDDEKIFFSNQLKISKHLSSIRCICIFDFHEKYILFSAGGRAQICAWELKKSADDYFFDCTELSQHLMKGSDVDKKGERGWKQVEMNSDAETRFMSLACLDSSHFPHIRPGNDVVLFSGCSDGHLRIYSFKSTFELLKSCEFNSKCILKVHIAVFKTRPIVFTVSTDGIMTIWDFSLLGAFDDIRPVYRKRYHKAGINSFDVKKMDDDKILIATGGDDNDIQLNIMVLSLKSDCDSLSVEEVCKWHYDKYHSSQITEIKILYDDYIISTSIDQRVTILKMIYDDSKIDLDCKYVGQYHSNVSDIQGMTILDNVRNNVTICLFGKGIEIMRIELPN